MDGFALGLFLFAAFFGGFASGLAGFAMGFIVAGIWLHIITPIQTTALIAGYGLCTQGYGVWKLRHALNWRNVAPFIVGGAVGVPIGTTLLRYADPAYLRGGVGVLLVIYGLYDAAGVQTVEGRPHRRWRRWVIERNTLRTDGLSRFHHNDLVSIAGLEERLSARSFPAGFAGGYRCKRHIVSCRPRDHRRHFTAVPDRSAGHACGPVGRVQAVWQT